MPYTDSQIQSVSTVFFFLMRCELSYSVTVTLTQRKWGRLSSKLWFYIIMGKHHSLLEISPVPAISICIMVTKRENGALILYATELAVLVGAQSLSNGVSRHFLTSNCTTLCVLLNLWPAVSNRIPTKFARLQ